MTIAVSVNCLASSSQVMDSLRIWYFTGLLKPLLSTTDCGARNCATQNGSIRTASGLVDDFASAGSEHGAEKHAKCLKRDDGTRCCDRFTRPIVLDSAAARPAFVRKR